jgi:hypothetical protein
MLLALNVVNPDALVVHRNAGRTLVGTTCLADLSNDAVPALVHANLPSNNCDDNPYTGGPRPTGAATRRTRWGNGQPCANLDGRGTGDMDTKRMAGIPCLATA